MESQSGRGVGNSMQDLYLSLYGYKLGRFIRKGDRTARDAAALRIRTDLAQASQTDTAVRRQRDGVGFAGMHLRAERAPR
jgi:hypothetical protein